MNTIQREQIRLSLLRCLDANPTRWGLANALLLQMIRSEGFSRLDEERLRAELQYLADRRLVERIPKHLSPENECWRITADGRDFVAGNLAG